MLLSCDRFRVSTNLISCYIYLMVKSALHSEQHLQIYYYTNIKIVKLKYSVELKILIYVQYRVSTFIYFFFTNCKLMQSCY